MNLATLGEDNVRTFGEYPALAFEGRELTNVDLQRAANRLAGALRGLGVGPGDRVVVLLPNCPEVLQAYAAILKLGAVIVPVVFLLGQDATPEQIRELRADLDVGLKAIEILGFLDGEPRRLEPPPPHPVGAPAGGEEEERNREDQADDQQAALLMDLMLACLGFGIIRFPAKFHGFEAARRDRRDRVPDRSEKAAGRLSAKGNLRLQPLFGHSPRVCA